MVKPNIHEPSPWRDHKHVDAEEMHELGQLFNFIIHNLIVLHYKTHVKSHQNLWEWDLEFSFNSFYLQTIVMQKSVKMLSPVSSGINILC